MPQAIALAGLTRPKPFGPRTPELGEYLGVFEAGILVATAGERLQVRGHREISGVCTHPAQRGRGLARRRMLKLVRSELQRGETPFLHVMADNRHARALYERMGFREDRVATIRVIACAQPVRERRRVRRGLSAVRSARRSRAPPRRSPARRARR